MNDEKMNREYIPQMAEYIQEARQAVEKCINFSNDYSAKNTLPLKQRAFYVLSWKKPLNCMLELLKIAENQFTNKADSKI